MIKILSKEQIVLVPTTNSAYRTGDENNLCTEECPLRPISQYPIEKEIMQKQNSASCRLATVFGMSSRMRAYLLAHVFTYRAVNDGFVVLFESYFKINYVHIRDAFRAFQHAISSFESLRGHIYKVALLEVNISKNELCKVIQKQIPYFTFIDESVGNDTVQRNYIVSNEKIEKAGFTSLDEGLSELIKGYTMIKKADMGIFKEVSGFFKVA